MSGEANTTFQYLIIRRLASAFVDISIELGGGLLGSYFGALVAALVTALRHHDPIVMQDSIWRGLGFGFVFCAFAIGFVNRVLIQGLSRASIGKKLFHLELVSSTREFTWQLMIGRWVLSQLAIATGGITYLVMFFNPEHRALHDIYMGTDVVPSFQATYIIDVEYQPQADVTPFMPMFHQLSSRTIVLTHDSAERPSATVIQLPAAVEVLQIAEAPKHLPVERVASLADMIEVTPLKDEDDQAA